MPHVTESTAKIKPSANTKCEISSQNEIRQVSQVKNENA